MSPAPTPQIADGPLPPEFAAAAGGETALNVAVVTDDPDAAAACERILRSAGHRVRAARHSGHAHLLSLAGERIDVLLVELAMADGSGPALASRMRRHHPHLRCLYLAPAGCPETPDLLVRPFSEADLLARLRRLRPSAS